MNAIHKIAQMNLEFPGFPDVLVNLGIRYPKGLLPFIQNVWSQYHQSYDTLLPEVFQFTYTPWMYRDTHITITNHVTQLQIVLGTLVEKNMWVYLTLDLIELLPSIVQARLWITPGLRVINPDNLLYLMLDQGYRHGFLEQLKTLT